MLVAVVVLALLAGLLAVLYVRERQARSHDRTAHEDELLRVAAEVEAAQQDLKVAREEAAAERDALAELRDQVDTTEERLRLSEAERLAAVEDLDAARARAEEAETRAAALDDEREALSGEIVPLRERLLELDAQSARIREEHRPGLEAEALWALELARSERTWRHSVAIAPDQASPFVTTEDPLALAVEIEVAAVREEVGVAMELDWDAPIEEPSRCLTVLRLAQELLAVAAHQQQAVILRGRLDENGDVVLRIDVPEGAPPLEVEPPPLGEHLVTATNDDGLQLVVH